MVFSVKVVLFCGGRGSRHLIRELVEDLNIELTLIVNAYDDGLSTGEIRKLIPGMLGPSDFRKNLGYLLVPASEDHMNFSKILEHRLKINTSSYDSIKVLSKTSIKHNLAQQLIASDARLLSVFDCLPETKKNSLLELFSSFLLKVYGDSAELRALQKLEDFAVGNILLAGAYIQNENSFSKANDFICSLFDIRARILNVSDDNRFLVALTSEGEFVRGEAEIVAGDFEGRLQEVFLLRNPMSNLELENFNAFGAISEKHFFLKNLESIPALNPQVSKILNSADVVIYGSGTQHSSLFPTYKVLAGNNVVPKSSSKRIFVSNLESDLDIDTWSGTDLLVGLSRHFGISCYSDLVDVIIADQKSPIGFEGLDSQISLHIVPLRDNSNYGAHDGRKLVDQIYLSLFKETDTDVEIRVFNSTKDSTHSRMWHKVQGYDFGALPYNVDCKVIEVNSSSESAIRHFNDWLADDSKSRFLILYTCEGETSIGDLMAGITLMKSLGIPVLSGSRTQARRQWLEATGRTYGEGRLRFNFSIVATLLAVFISMTRRRQLLTDPLSRCILVDRLELKTKRNFVDSYNGKTIPGLRTFLLTNGVDVAEFPIRYRVFKGYKAYVNPTRDAINGFIEIMKLP